MLLCVRQQHVLLEYWTEWNETYTSRRAPVSPAASDWGQWTASADAYVCRFMQLTHRKILQLAISIQIESQPLISVSGLLQRFFFLRCKHALTNALPNAPPINKRLCKYRLARMEGIHSRVCVTPPIICEQPFKTSGHGRNAAECVSLGKDATQKCARTV